MDFEISHNSRFTIIQVKVEKLDINTSSALKSELVSINKQGVNSIILDLSLCTYCDSSGLSSILIANRLCKDTNGTFILCGLNSKVMKMVEISQLDTILKIFPTLKEAEEQFSVRNDV
jgi:anti-anti-sigma factor